MPLPDIARWPDGARSDGARPASAAPEEPAADQVHRDMAALTKVVGELAEALKPLAVLAEHVPALVEMARAWDATKNGGKAVGRFGLWLGGFARWTTTVATGLGLLWMAFHARWSALLPGAQP